MAEKIAVTIDVRFRGPYPLTDNDLFSLLTNLIQNAREAAVLVQGDRVLSVELSLNHESFCINIENSSTGQYAKDRSLCYQRRLSPFQRLPA